MERREPYSEKQINDINETDTNLAISGMIISKTDSSFVMDDGTGQLIVLNNDLEIIENKYIRVFGRLIPNEDNFNLQADIIQDLSKIDTFLYNKVKKILK
ncbi:hypothetical protein CL621_01720 [archaeon]|nr:hypothetical protein [archaeon]|tara:strand:+ start:996 stop:1295 length:300 start_codon:yes stop_codon:yes gene_type:complete